MQSRFALLAIALFGCARKPAPSTVAPDMMEVEDVAPGVTVSAKLEYYDVSAATLNGIRQAMFQAGPRSDGRTWGAVTTWNYVWTYQVERMGATGCEVRQAQVKVTMLTTFPRWNPTATPDSALLEWWEQYRAGLAEHERGHAVRAAQGGAEIVKALKGVLAFCDVMRNQTTAAANRILGDIKAQQAEYDRVTQHGGTQIQQARRLREP
jgi:predicted secreted Zn-dependent protease